MVKVMAKVKVRAAVSFLAWEVRVCLLRGDWQKEVNASSRCTMFPDNFDRYTTFPGNSDPVHTAAGQRKRAR